MGCNTSKENQGSGDTADNNKENENQIEAEVMENHSNGKSNSMLSSLNDSL